MNVGTDLDVRAELNLGGVWTDVSGFTFQDSTSIQRGNPNESTTASPSVFTALWDNSDGRFSSLNPTGPYYGSLGLNTDVRVSIPEGASYLRLEGDTSSYAQGPAPFPTGFSAGIDVQVDVTLDNWYAAQYIAAQWATSGSEQSWILTAHNDGTLGVALSGTGSNTFSVSSTAAVGMAHGRLSVRVTYNTSTQTVTFYTGTLLTGWTQLGSTVAVASGPASIFTSTTDITVGAGPLVTGGNPGINGKVHAFQISAFGGSVLASADFTSLTPGTTGWTDAQSNAWTLTGTSEISNRKYRFHGEIAAWPQSWSPGGSNAKVNISAGGLLRRISQGGLNLQSALYRAWTRFSGNLTPVAYWPCEDASLSTQIASGVGGSSMLWFGGPPSLASYSALVSSAPLPVMNGAQFTATVPSYSLNPGPTGVNTDSIVRFVFAVPSGGDTNNSTLCSVFYKGGTVGRIDLVYNTVATGSLEINGFDHGGTSLWTSTFGTFNANGAQYAGSIELRQTTATAYSATFTTLSPGGAFAGSVTGASSVTGTVGVISKIVFNSNPSALMTGTAFGHVGVQTTFTSLFAIANPLDAWVGETAGRRFQRLCGEEGVAFRGVGNLDGTTVMGAQTIETFTTLLQECVDADQGMMFEPKQCLALGYRTMASLGNQTPAFALDYQLDHLGGAPSPTQDDQLIKNDVTVTAQNSGSSSRQVLLDGSALAANGMAGRYDTQLTINVATDSQLDSEAGWILHTSTVNEPRYPTLNVDLANTALIPLYYQVLEAEVGDRFTVANPPAWLPPGLIDQVVMGYTETLSRKALFESYNGRPASAFNVAYFDDPVFGRFDTAGSSLAAPATSTATTIEVATNSGPAWSSSAGDFPYDVNVGGEQMTVTAVANGSPAGSQVGAFMSDTVMGATAGDFTTAYANWQSLTCPTIGVSRVYRGAGFSINTDMSDMISAGVKMCIDFTPSASLSPTDRASLDSVLSAMKTAGAVADVALWHEPFFNGLTAAQYIAVYRYYGPTVRKYYPLVCVFSGPDADPANGYYPGDAWVDKIAVDAYAGSSTLQVTNAMSIADNANPPKPFGVWEFNGSTDPVNGQSQLAVTTFFTYIQATMLARIAAGKANADVLLFNAGNANWLGTGLSLNAGFEGSGTGQWFGAGGCSVANSTAQAHSGTHSLAITATGTANMLGRAYGTPSGGLPVVPGNQVKCNGWFRANTVARSCQMVVTWYTSGGTQISQSFGGSVADSTTGWTQATFTTSGAPATAAFATPGYQIASPAGAGEVHYLDDVELQLISTGTSLVTPIQFAWDYRIPLLTNMKNALNGTNVPQNFTVTRSANGVVKGHVVGEDVRLFTPPIYSL
jgi:hypothetical protein